MDIQSLLIDLSLSPAMIEGGDITVQSPIDGARLGTVASDNEESCNAKIARSVNAFTAWREVPAPRRGELVRLFSEKLREKKQALGRLVTLETGKILQEGLGEVQEMIDICDFAVGISRQLYGLTIASERPGHKMREYWHPLGPVGVISAFNFPVAVWAWNTALALVCGDSVLWKPSEKTPLTAFACQALLEDTITAFGTDAPEGLSQLLIGGRKVGEQLVTDTRVPLISATGSSAMGRVVGERVAGRFGRSILELGGNNAVIVAPSADLDLALKAVAFGAVGTCGQRCTTTRRLFLHDSIYDKFVKRLKATYDGLSIGDPFVGNTLVGPLIDEQSFLAMEDAISHAQAQGGEVTGGGRALTEQFPNAFYVQPAIIEMAGDDANVMTETFAPILYVFRYTALDNAIERQNAVPQGLSSTIITRDIGEAERFTCQSGSDCGIANVNIGTSGAEIGGAFGGEKETGGGRESGSDAWKGYMRRMTSTVNYSNDLPLAQGIEYEL